MIDCPYKYYLVRHLTIERDKQNKYYLFFYEISYAPEKIEEINKTNTLSTIKSRIYIGHSSLKDKNTKKIEYFKKINKENKFQYRVVSDEIDIINKYILQQKDDFVRKRLEARIKIYEILKDELTDWFISNRVPLPKCENEKTKAVEKPDQGKIVEDAYLDSEKVRQAEGEKQSNKELTDKQYKSISKIKKEGAKILERNSHFTKSDIARNLFKKNQFKKYSFETLRKYYSTTYSYRGRIIK